MHFIVFKLQLDFDTVLAQIRWLNLWEPLQPKNVT